jgi:hypothetical protein
VAPETLTAQTDAVPFGFGPDRAPFVVLGGREAFEGKTVTGAPYSARTETEIIQTLVDGNRILQKTAGFVARDSAGRVRREQSIAAVGPLFGRAESPRIVAVVDPVEGVAFFLDERARTAHPRPLRDIPGPPIDRASPDGGRRPALAEETAESPLGTRMEGGVRVDGVRRTITTPAGAVGNEKAIVAVVERWYSPDLQLLVSTVHQDPRFGEIRFRLTDITATEPEASLFRVPEGYEIVVGRNRRSGAGPLPPPPPGHLED